MSRWQVRRNKWFKNSMVGNPLEYTPGWSVTCDGEIAKLGGFSTWREAMAYADEQARTVEVTVPGDPWSQLPKGITLRKSPIDWYVYYDERFVYVPCGALKPLALALLAAHCKEKK
ncbi:hypothetical protein [Corynebacterium ulcerans]|uniref:hypothetical protein n=1 Tax=Corynebacterium ulcerans TaxID=65058 RepID=UPI0003C7D703|nr:hypothetical protein [Corynebacterium ulcerans]ESU57458.1 hypothetical protein D881_10740 [Corynebacterium ulcerans NCTC 12077]STC82268.1 Uncharacterised protein [Corynebacterium ulcerans]